MNTVFHDDPGQDFGDKPSGAKSGVPPSAEHRPPRHSQISRPAPVFPLKAKERQEINVAFDKLIRVVAQ